jgi:hypothetical protein
MMSILSGHDDNYTLFRRARSTRWKRVLLGLFAAPALMVGLLAMHVLAASGDTTGQHASMSVTAPVAQMTDSIPGDATVGACDQFCGPTHDMGAMACLLALLLTTFTIAALVAFRGWISAESLLSVLALMAARLSSLAPPSPPSLTFLSISRI